MLSPNIKYWCQYWRTLQEAAVLLNQGTLSHWNLHPEQLTIHLLHLTWIEVMEKEWSASKNRYLNQAMYKCKLWFILAAHLLVTGHVQKSLNISIFSNLMTDIKSNSILSWANRQPFLQFYEALYRGPRCVRGCGNVSQIVGRCVSVQCPHVSVSGARSVASGPATLAHIKWRWSLQLISLFHSPHITMVAAQVSKHLINSRYADM